MKGLSIYHKPMVILLTLASLLSGSCSKDEEETVPSISDYNFYMMVGVSMIHCYTDIYNQNLAGVPTGSHNISTPGPMGGTAVITGTTTYDNTHGITTTDLVVSMNAVEYLYSYTDGSGKTWMTSIVLTGATTYAGSFSNTYTSVNHLSNNLNISATVTYDGITRSMNESGQVSINRSSNVAVNIFGHTVSW